MSRLPLDDAIKGTRSGIRIIYYCMSRPVFAMYLRTNTRTLENWEQGRVKPNAQTVILIRLVQKFPETVEHLAALA